MDTRRSLPGALLSDLSGFVASRMGLHFPQERWADLERGVVAAAREFGLPDAEACARRLLSAPLTQTHVEILAGHLTVGETYFFREKNSLDALEQHIVPELLRSRRDGERRLRIWSAGCCTGEEPYSVAMLLDRVIPDPKEWIVTILATDINPRFLRKAARGVYGEWSFRGAPEWVKERYFSRRKDGRLELQPHISGRVTFSYLNLAEDVYPSLLNNTNAMDVIFCRNVLMYFTAERAQSVARKLHRSLVDGGWLIVSPTETSNTLFPSFSAIGFPGAVLYRKIARAEPVAFRPRAPAPETDALHPRAPAVAPAPVAAELPGLPLEAAPATPEPGKASPPEEDDARAPSVAARRCADQGRLAEAIEWCEKAIAADKLNPAHHFLFAAIQQEQGRAEQAVRSLSRALYLDPGFVLAHFALGNIELSRGRRREARRHFANALALLRTRPHDEILAESEGLTAGRLVQIVTSVLASLPRAAAAQA